MLGSVHDHTHLLVGLLIGIFHHQGIAAWPLYCHLQLDIHLGGQGNQRPSQPPPGEQDPTCSLGHILLRLLPGALPPEHCRHSALCPLFTLSSPAPWPHFC